MSDPKLTAQMLDLSRNIEKLTGAVKTNTESTDQLQKANSDSDKGLKDIASNLKNLNFKDISKEFKDISKNIKDLDFKKIGEDFKGVTKSFGEIGKNLGDIKSLKDIPKSFGDISKSLGGIKDLGKDFKGIKDLGKNIGEVTKDLKGVGKIKDIVSGGIGKKILGAFADGGPVEETGSYLVGERGPEVVKLEEGSKVVPNEKLVTADQKLTEKKGPTEKQISKYKNYLLGEYPDHYEEFPEFLEGDVKDWIDRVRYQSSDTIDSLLEGKGETFTKEDVAKLSTPVKPESALSPTAEAELSKKEKRKKEKEEERLAKEEAKTKKNESKLEKSSERKEKLSDLTGNLKETGKKALSGDMISKATTLGAGLLSKNIKTENPLAKKAIESGIKFSSDNLAKSLQKPELVSNILPLKKAAPKKSESEEKKSTSEESIESKKAEQDKASQSASSIKDKESVSSTKSQESSEKSSSKSETNISKNDIDDIKSALFRMASLLEGTLTVSPIESPYRPNSRRI